MILHFFSDRFLFFLGLLCFDLLLIGYITKKLNRQKDIVD